MDVCMGGWMDGWMDGWNVDRWIRGWMDGRVDGWAGGWADVRFKGWTSGCVDGMIARRRPPLPLWSDGDPRRGLLGGMGQRQLSA